MGEVVIQNQLVEQEFQDKATMAVEVLKTPNLVNMQLAVVEEL